MTNSTVFSEPAGVEMAKRQTLLDFFDKPKKLKGSDEVNETSVMKSDENSSVNSEVAKIQSTDEKYLLHVEKQNEMSGKSSLSITENKTLIESFGNTNSIHNYLNLPPEKKISHFQLYCLKKNQGVKNINLWKNGTNHFPGCILLIMTLVIYALNV